MDRLPGSGGDPNRNGEQDGNGQQHHDGAMTDQRDYRRWSVLWRPRRIFRPDCEPLAGVARVVGRVQETELQFTKHDRWRPPDKGRRRVVPVYPHVLHARRVLLAVKPATDRTGATVLGYRAADCPEAGPLATDDNRATRRNRRVQRHDDGDGPSTIGRPGPCGVAGLRGQDADDDVGSVGGGSDAVGGHEQGGPPAHPARRSRRPTARRSNHVRNSCASAGAVRRYEWLLE
jgi:hypothetical protein